MFECPSYSGRSNKLASFILKVDQTMSTGESDIFSAESLFHFKSKVAEVFNVTEPSLKLCSVQKGCLEILFETPSYVMDVILSQLDRKEQELCALGIQKVWYGDEEVFSTLLETHSVNSKVQLLRMFSLLSPQSNAQINVARPCVLDPLCMRKNSGKLSKTLLYDTLCMLPACEE